METLFIISLLATAYLIGSIPSAVWIGRTFFNIDVREFGSGNAGATNTFRVLGKKAGIPVLIIDILKGSLAVLLVRFTNFEFESSEYINMQLGLGVASLVGHIFPVFAGFRGGKGVATLLGVVISILPLSCGLSLVVFIVVLLLTRYVSLSSMMAGVSFPLFLNFILKNENEVLMFFSITVAVLLIITHRKNIIRLYKKQESKIPRLKVLK